MKILNRFYARLPNFLRKRGFLLPIAACGIVVIVLLVLQIYWVKPPLKSPSSQEINYRVSSSNLDLSEVINKNYDGHGFMAVEWLGSYNQVDHQVITYQSEGLQQFGLMTLPGNPQPINGYPVVVICHGYEYPLVYSSTGMHYVADMQALSAQGYAVIRPDYRGHGLSEGVAEGAYYSNVYTTDVINLLKATKDVPYLDDTKLALVGHSMGAYVALKSAVVSPVEPRSVVLIAGGNGNVEDMVERWVAPSDLNNPVAASIKERVISEHGKPSTNPAYWQRTSPLNYLYRLRGPVQIHTAVHDNVVPPYFSSQLASALGKANIAHQYFEYPNGDHSLTRQRNELWPRMFKFLEDSLY